MLGIKNHFDISDGIEICEVDIAGVACILFWSQFVSVCFAMKLFFSFKIDRLQMLQLFQTRDGQLSIVPEVPWIHGALDSMPKMAGVILHLPAGLFTGL